MKKQSYPGHHESETEIHSVLHNSLRPPGLYRARLLCPWNSPGKYTGGSFLSLLQGIKLGSSTLQADSLPSEPPGKPIYNICIFRKLWCIYKSVVCRWTFGLFVYLGCCKWCCCEHWGACFFSIRVFVVDFFHKYLDDLHNINFIYFWVEKFYLFIYILLI